MGLVLLTFGSTMREPVITTSSTNDDSVGAAAYAVFTTVKQAATAIERISESEYRNIWSLPYIQYSCRRKNASWIDMTGSLIAPSQQMGFTVCEIMCVQSRTEFLRGVHGAAVPTITRRDQPRASM